MPIDLHELDRKRLLRLLQVYKAKYLVHLSPEERDAVRAYLHELDEKYTNYQINIEEYRFLSLTFLLKDWDPARREQFLYRHGDKYITQAEKYAIAEFSPQKLPD